MEGHVWGKGEDETLNTVLHLRELSDNLLSVC
jgi:hypothetical protein